jgi:hypothetical protein
MRYVNSTVNLDALGHEGSKAMGFVIIEVQIAGALRESARVSFAMRSLSSWLLYG